MEFLNELKRLLRIERTADFSRMCGKQNPNMINYLNGTRNPGSRVLEDCLLNATISRVFYEPLDASDKFATKAKRLRSDVLSSVTSNLFGQEIEPLSEVVDVPNERGSLPTSGGVYILYDSAGNVLYIGKAQNFRTEVWQTLGRRIPVGMRFGPDMRRSRPNIQKLASYMSLYEIENERLRHNIEALLIRVFINQTHNSNIAHFRTSEAGR